MQRNFYKSGTSDHLEHNSNPDYHNILLKYVSQYSGINKKALDFGCGKGRNIKNLLGVAEWASVDGCDISSSNIHDCMNRFPANRHRFYLCDTHLLGGVKHNEYDFVLSTITLQHIPIHKLRHQILVEIYLSMKNNALFSFQLGYGFDLNDKFKRSKASYYQNSYFANSTNGNHDFRVSNPNEIVQELKGIGFQKIEFEVRNSYLDYGHDYWIYVHAFKN